MGEIKVTVKDLTDAAAKFTSAASRCAEMKEEIKTSTIYMMDQWTGNSKNAFEHEYQIIYKNMNTYGEILRDISDELTAIAKGFEDIDIGLKNEILKNIK